MNAISRPVIEDRVAWHIRMCQELAELGQSLAREVHRQAVADLAAMATDAETLVKRPRATPDRGQLFLRLSNTVRQLIALERRLVDSLAPGPGAADSAATGSAAPGTKLPDLRRDIIRRAIDVVTAQIPNRVRQRRAATAKLDEYLAADPAGDIGPRAMLHKILGPLGIPINDAKMPADLAASLT